MNSHAIARIVVRATARERDVTRIKPAVHQRRSSVPRGDIKILPFTPHILDFCCSISRDSTDEILMLARVVVHQRAELWRCCTVIWSSPVAASTRRDDARCCAPPNASRAAPFRHQPAAPDAASALSSRNRPSASQQAPRGDLARDPKNYNKIIEFSRT